MLSKHARAEWLAAIVIGVLLTVAAVLVGLWWLAVPLWLVVIAVCAFFRDPDRSVPPARGAVVAPADGRVSSIHEVDHFEPFDGPATCVRIFMSLLDVHVTRNPCHGEVASVAEAPGKRINALKPESVEDNASVTLTLVHPMRRTPVAAVRLIAGMIARTIVVHVDEGAILQRGQRTGIIKLGSSAEVYLPAELRPLVTVEQGQRVTAGETVIAKVQTKARAADDADDHDEGEATTETPPHTEDA